MNEKAFCNELFRELFVIAIKFTSIENPLAVSIENPQGEPLHSKFGEPDGARRLFCLHFLLNFFCSNILN